MPKKSPISAYSIYAKGEGETDDRQASDQKNNTQWKRKMDNKQNTAADQTSCFNGDFVIPLVSKSIVGSIHSKNPRKKKKSVKHVDRDSSRMEGIPIANHHLMTIFDATTCSYAISYIRVYYFSKVGYVRQCHYSIVDTRTI